MLDHGLLLAVQFICISYMLNVLAHSSAAPGYMLIIQPINFYLILKIPKSNEL